MVRKQSKSVPQTTTPNEDTPQETGGTINLGELRRTGKEVTRTTLERCLYKELKVKGYGTSRLECQALKLVEEGKSVKAVNTLEAKRTSVKKSTRIAKYRDVDIVNGLLEQEITQCRKEEEQSRNSYKKIKKQL